MHLRCPAMHWHAFVWCCNGTVKRQAWPYVVMQPSEALVCAGLLPRMSRACHGCMLNLALAHNCLYKTQTLHPCSGAKEGASAPPKPAALKEELVGCLLLTLQQHPAAKLPRAFSPLNSTQEGKMSAVLEAAANQHAHYVLAAWLGTAKIALQVSSFRYQQLHTPAHGHWAIPVTPRLPCSMLLLTSRAQTCCCGHELQARIRGGLISGGLLTPAVHAGSAICRPAAQHILPSLWLFMHAVSGLDRPYQAVLPAAEVFA